jgi:hypothetical protein
MAQLLHEREWLPLLARIAEVIDLETSARTSGALRRRRRITRASDLLRLVLAYGPGGQSLRQTAAWAALQGIAELSAVALMFRVRDAADWLAAIAGCLLAGRAAAAPLPGGRRIRIVDGSVITAPGTATNWRLHAIYDLAEQRFSHFELTDIHGAEALERSPVSPGEIRLADRVYARPDGLRHILEAGGDFLVRVGSRSLRLAGQDGRPFKLSAALRCSRQTGTADVPVLIHHGRSRRWTPQPARLVILRLPPGAAKNARKRAQRASQRGGHANDARSLATAGHLMLITSLPADEYPPERLAAIYRLRWQIELAFKRLKSLLHIDQLPAKDPDLARAWILAHLIAALLVEDISPQVRESPPCGQRGLKAIPLALAHHQDAA